MADARVRSRYSRTHRHDQPSENTEPDRIRCSVCGFPGVDIDTEPGGGFPTTFVTSGTTYVWTAANDAISGLDYSAEPSASTSSSCPFCGATRFLDGSRGSGNAIP